MGLQEALPTKIRPLFECTTIIRSESTICFRFVLPQAFHLVKGADTWCGQRVSEGNQGITGRSLYPEGRAWGTLPL